ncbi:MAG: hypothetical protein AAFN78_01530 [Pseudomonadota bacterium]
MKALVTVLFLIVSASPALAAEEDNGEQMAAADTASAEAQSMEEITVLGQMNMTQLEKTVERAKLDFWDSYNAVNDVDEFRMVCEKVARTGTHIKTLQCAPSYYLEASRKQTERALRTGGARNSRSIARSLEKKKKEADAHMVALVEENPELLDKWNYLLAANQTYEQRKASN